ncbi:hypothetical protein ACEQ8H_000153 [Pleosporales sp. CAS-2024a]
MRSHTPLSNCSKSPALTCRWKRGIPVTARAASNKPTNVFHAPFLPHLALPSATAPTQDFRGRHAQLRHASTASQAASPHKIGAGTPQPLQLEEKDKEQEEEHQVEEHIELTYQIPENTLRSALQATPHTRPSFWSARMYRGPEDQTLTVHYCRTYEVAERVARHFRKEKVLGFDIEWRPFSHPMSIKKNVSLIQLACENRIALFHISLFIGTKAEQLVPPTLKTILESPDILKLDDDPADTANVRQSDWSQPLEPEQIYYASDDAYAGFRLYHVLEWKRKQLRPTPPTRGICDDDTKAKPRVTKKKTTKKRKTADESTPILVQSVDEQSQQQEPLDMDDSEGSEEYETAAEDSVDSHELEDPVEASSVKGNSHGPHHVTTRVDEHPTRKRRVNLAWLKGPDPHYPALPRDSGDRDTAPCSPSDVISAASSPNDTESNPSQSAILEDEEDDDEFADPELEAALQNLGLDEDGKLTDNPSASINMTNSQATGVLDIAPQDNPTRPVPEEAHLVPVSNLDSINEAEMDRETDLSHLDPIHKELHEASLLPVATVTPSPNAFSRSHEYNTATVWARKYLDSTVPAPTCTGASRIRATITHLRTYHLWRHQHLSIQTIAGLVRDPPLSHSAVTGYILQAITLERLEYDSDGLRNIMMDLPVGLRKGRWKAMADKVGATN